MFSKSKQFISLINVVRDEEIRIWAKLFVNKRETYTMIIHPIFDEFWIIGFFLLLYKSVIGHDKGIPQSGIFEHFFIVLFLFVIDCDHTFDLQIMHELFVFDPFELEFFDHKLNREFFFDPKKNGGFYTFKIKFLGVSNFNRINQID